MFAKSKVTQSMIDAVQKVLNQQPVVEEKQEEVLNEAGTPIKEPTSTGMRVYGRSYGNSAKAKQDQTKSAVDDLKGPKDKEVKEELKGNQDKIDANKNDKIDAQDFKILRNKKVKEDMHFANKLLETVRKSDVPAYLRKAKGDTPLTVADVKGPKKDSISAPENLAKARNEEVELDEASYTTKRNPDGTVKSGAVDQFTKAGGKVEKGYFKIKGSQSTERNADGSIKKSATAGATYHKEEIEDLSEEQLDEMLNEVLGKDATAGDWIHDFVHSDNPKFAGKSKAERKKMALGAYYGKQNEESEQIEERDEGKPGLNFKKIAAKASKEYGSKEAGNRVAGAIRKKVLAKEDTEQIEEVTIAGTPGWKETKKDVKDKSGAVHTPMSRARDLARAAFKKIQKEVK